MGIIGIRILAGIGLIGRVGAANENDGRRATRSCSSPWSPDCRNCAKGCSPPAWKWEISTGFAQLMCDGVDPEGNVFHLS